jgi:hypothetical protein
MSDNILLLTEGGDYLVTEDGDYIIAVVQYLITTVNGSYTVTGQSATLLKSKSLTVNYGTYSVTGQSATIEYEVGYTIIALNGVYSITGYDANITWTAGIQYPIELRSFTERRRM